MDDVILGAVSREVMGKLMVGDSEKRDTYRISWIDGLAMILLTLLCWLWLGGTGSRFILRFHQAGQPQFVCFLLDIAVAFIPFLCMGLGLWASLKFIVRMPLQMFTTDSERFRWRLAFCSLGITFICGFCFELIGYLVNPEGYMLKFTVNWGARLLSLPLLLVLIPMQTSCEELLFRCLPVRMVFGRLPSSWGDRALLCLLSSILFVLPHLANPELLATTTPFAVLTYYALFGLLAMASAVLTGGFEVALGVHAANNLFASLVCGYPESPLPGIPLMTNLNTVNSWIGCLQLLLTFALIGGILHAARRKSNRLVLGDRTLRNQETDKA